MHPNEVDTADAPNWLYRPSFPDAWPKAKLSSLARWINGMAFKDFQFSASGRPIIKIAEIKNGIAGQTKFTLADYDKVYLIHKGDLLFSWSGQPETSIDAFWWPGPDGWLNQHVFKVVPNQALVSQDFLYYLLKYLNPNFVAIARNKQTTGLGHVTKADIAAMEVGIPPPEEQKAIVDQIWSIDRKIDLNRQINQTLEQMAQALFQSWFVDFEPVKAKVAALADGRDPLRAAMSTLSGKTDAELDELPGVAFDTLAATAALFPEEMEESGEMPKGWEICTLTDFCNLNAKSWGSTSLPEQIHYIDLANAKNGVITEVQPFSAQAAPSRARRVLRPGDTIVGTVRPGNRSFALIGATSTQLTGSTGFAVLSPRQESQRELVYLLATSEQNIGRLTRLADGAAYPAVLPGVVTKEAAVNPGNKVVKAFHEIARPLFDKALSNLAINDELATLRDSLLPKMLSGELAVTMEGGGPKEEGPEGREDERAVGEQTWD